MVVGAVGGGAVVEGGWVVVGAGVGGAGVAGAGVGAAGVTGAGAGVTSGSGSTSCSSDSK